VERGRLNRGESINFESFFEPQILDNVDNAAKTACLVFDSPAKLAKYEKTRPENRCRGVNPISDGIKPPLQNKADLKWQTAESANGHRDVPDRSATLKLP
jgi:hypothetical protein